MLYADTRHGRIEAEPGLQGACPQCGTPMVPKCGDIVSWHWAHTTTANCDPWSEGEGEWHRGWKRRLEVRCGARSETVLTLDQLIDTIAKRGGIGPAQDQPLFTETPAPRYADFTR